jgi:hypothetical protein
VSSRADLVADRVVNWPFAVALVALVANDAWAKAALSNTVTGKLSDLAGLYIAPLLALAAIDAVAGRRCSTRTATVTCIVTAAVFAAAKTNQAANSAIETSLDAIRATPLHLRALLGDPAAIPDPAVITMDRSDVACIAIVAAAWFADHQLRARTAPRAATTAPAGAPTRTPRGA